MNPVLEQQIVDRLSTDEALDENVVDLVLAACEGSSSLEAALSGEAPRRQPISSPPAAESVEPPGAYLARLEVQGFRGIGPRVALELAAGPGLTLVVGRNGSGKSSFAEGLELLLTGQNSRWVGRTKVWSEGWRNLHESGAPCLEARMHVEGGPGLTHLRRQWAPGDALDHGTLEVHGGDGSETSLEELGWTKALDRYRPFLSYNELGTMFDRLPTMYDALAAILGLGEIDDLGAVLREARLARERLEREVKARRDDLLVRLSAGDDPRSRAVEAALRARPADLDAAELAAEGLLDDTDPASEIASLRALSALIGPSAEELSGAFEELEAAADRMFAIEGTNAAADSEVAALLEAAITHHSHHPTDRCPVCGTDGVLDDDWRKRASVEASTRRERAAAYDRAERDLRDAERTVASLWSHLKSSGVAEAGAVGLDAAAVQEVHRTWQTGATQLGSSADRQRAHHVAERLGAVVADLAARAETELSRREDAWRPLAADLRTFIPDARKAQGARGEVAALKAAESWVKVASADLQAERLAPIADAARHNWGRLRQESNVALERFALRRSGNVRSAEIDVRVDGTGASALGVMSQGELHALAVSVFLPRAGLADSPFRFIVIDDPVQSMDPAKVDGLARVLDDVGRRRQVIVFTHDERLPEAVRRLQLDATIIEVTRRPGSVVQVRAALDPVERYIDDARALLRSDEVAHEVMRRVVPGFCRHAIEAAATVAVRRRRLGRGDRHVEVELALERATTLMSTVALALFDDETKGGHVLSSINNRYGGRAGDALRTVNRGAHSAVNVDLQDLVRDSATLARQMSAVT